MDYLYFLCAGGCGEEKYYFIKVIQSCLRVVSIIAIVVLLAMALYTLITWSSKKNKISKKDMIKKVVKYLVIALVIFLVVMLINFILGNVFAQEYDEEFHCWCA